MRRSLSLKSWLSDYQSLVFHFYKNSIEQLKVSVKYLNTKKCIIKEKNEDKNEKLWRRDKISTGNA